MISDVILANSSTSFLSRLGSFDASRLPLVAAHAAQGTRPAASTQAPGSPKKIPPSGRKALEKDELAVVVGKGTSS